MNRLRRVFAEGHPRRMIAYLTAGDPSLDETVAIVQAAAGAGADVIELGIPFSDPSADGPAIQAAMARALSAGTTLPGALDAVRRIRAAGCDVAVVLFGYYNPIFVHGVDRFCREAAAAGADGVLVVDLPVDELGELAEPARAAGLETIPLLAPTSSAARMAAVAAVGAPFVYYVSITGVTGAALRGQEELPARLAAVRAAVRAPVAVGFGIATPADAAAVAAAGADAIVVGSAIVRTIERATAQDPGTAPAAVGRLVSALKAGLS